MEDTTSSTIDSDGLHKLVLAYKKLQDLPLATLEKKLAKTLEDESLAVSLGWLLTKKSGEKRSLSKAIESLERGAIPKTLQLQNVTPLENIYSIPELMFGPLLSRVRTGDGWIGKISDFIRITPKGNTSTARAVRYSVSRDCLKGTDARFVHLHLDKGGKADTHRHPGDELLYVLEGEVTLAIRSVGYLSRLKKGDLIHFHADLEHTAWAHADSELFIVRFFQLEGGGVRAYVRERFGSFMSAMREPAAIDSGELKQKFLEIEPWLRQISEPPEFVVEPKRITDMVGLGALLREIEKVFEVEPTKIFQRLQESGWKGSQTGFYNLWKGIGSTSAGVGDILLLSKALTTEEGNYPPNLFSSFIFPRVPNVVIIRNGSEDLFDLSSVEGFESSEPKVKYLTPRFNLMGSDVAINFIKIPKGKATAFNRHPGYELALPIEGQIEVRLESGGEYLADASLGQYVHYNSARSHRVAQTGRKNATVLIVRFFEYASHIKKKKDVDRPGRRRKEFGTKQSPSANDEMLFARS